MSAPHLSLTAQTPDRPCHPPADRMLADLTRGLKDGQFTAAGRLPTIRVLAQQYQISYGAARQAIEALERKGLVRRVRGSGTYVRQPTDIAPTVTYEAGTTVVPEPSHPQVRQIAVIYGGAILSKGRFNPPARDWTRGVRAGLSGRGIEVLITGGVGCVDSDGVFLDAIGSGEVDGAVIIGAQPEDGYLRHLVEHRVPTVAINRRPEFNEFSAVNIDNYGSGRQVIDFFIQRGHRRIGLFVGLDRYPYARERTAGALDALKSHGLEPALLDYLDTYDADVQVRDLCRRALDTGITALFVHGDRLAGLCTEACLDMGRRIPEQLSIIGYDDEGVTTRVGGLSTVGYDKLRMGRTAAALLLELLADREHLRTRSVTVATRIIERNTTGPAPEGRP